jgi:hypothetical protein
MKFTGDLNLKRNAFLICCWIAGFLAQSQGTDAFAAPLPQQPIYVFVTANVNDYVNWATSEERFRRTLAAIEKYRKDDPSLTATFYFSGAMSEALSQSNDKNHLLDVLKASIERGAIQPGYDGSDEPTYEHRSLLDFSKAKDAEERWKIRMESAKEILTQGHDPMTGAPQPGKSGGLKRMEEVFGPAVMIRGVVLQMPNLWGTINEVGSDAEIVNVIRQLNKTALMTGLPDSDLAHTAGSQFRPWANVFSKLMSPSTDTSPEMFWQEDELRLSETSELDIRTFRAEDGVEKLKNTLAALDRSHIRILHIELSSQRSYMKPPTPMMPRPTTPLGWAWQHPENPLFPNNLAYSTDEIEAHYAQQAEVLKYLASQFMPANPGSRFVSSADLKSRVRQGWGYDLSIASLRESLNDVLKKWGDTPIPPAYLKVEDRFLSLADLFEVLSDALAQQSHTGHLPATVRIGRVFGPVLTSQPRPLPEGEVTVESVARTCAKLVDALHDDSLRERPLNAIPAPIEIEGLQLTPAQFLRLMAEAFVAPTPETKLHIKPVEMFAGQVMTFYNRRARTDLGAPWTYKPAVLEPPASSRLVGNCGQSCLTSGSTN